MAKNVYHVVPKEDHWEVKKEGNERASSTHETQAGAIEKARSMASVGDEMVIHRPDGTIRENITVSGAGNGNGGSNGGRRRNELGVEDVLSVGSRVSWSAILAGAVVALTIYIALSFLAVALTVTTMDEMNATALNWTSGIVMIFISLISLFLGGFVVSRSTVGENKIEALTYGLLLWGTLLVFFILVGSTLGLGLGGLVATQAQGEAAPQATLADLEKRAEQNLDVDQETREKFERALQAKREGAEALNQLSPTALAWVMFGWIFLSMLAAILGSVTGAGPELVFKQLRDKRIVVKPAS